MANGFAPRPKPKKRNVIEQVYEDVTAGGRELIRQGKVAVEKIKEGARRVKRHLNK